MISKNQIISYSFTLLSAMLMLLSFPLSSNAQVLYTCSRDDNDLRIIDQFTGATLQTTPITLGGITLDGCTGLAKDPTSGVCWMLLKEETSPSEPRLLVKINPQTGVAKFIGDTGGPDDEFFASIAFDSEGTLYGVTGDGSTTSETLYTLSTEDGSPTFVQTLGNGNDGETLAFNPTDGLMYHTSGIAAPPDPTNVFESINLVTGVVTDIPITGNTSNYEEQTSMVYRLSNNDFLIANRSPDFLHSITPGGVVSQIGPLDEEMKGMAFDCQVEPSNVPTLSEWGLIAMAGILGIVGFMVIRRRKAIA